MPDDIDDFLGRYAQKKVDEEAQKQGVPVDFARRMAGTESSFRQSARSPKGAQGVMQLMPATAKGLGVDPNHLEQNIEGGVRYAKQQLDTFKDPSLAAAAYNSGPGRVRKLGRVPNIKETQDYVKKVAGDQPQDDVDEFLSRYQAPKEPDSRALVAVGHQTQSSPPQPRQQPPTGAQSSGLPRQQKQPTNKATKPIASPQPSKTDVFNRPSLTGQLESDLANLLPTPSRRMQKEHAVQRVMSDLRAEGAKAGRHTNVIGRSIVGAGAPIARGLAGVASLPGRVGSLVTGQDYDPAESMTSQKIGGLAEYMSGVGNPENSLVGSIPELAGNVAVGLGPGGAAGKLISGGGKLAALGRGALSGGTTMGALAAGTPAGNLDVARQAGAGAVAGAAGDIASKAAGTLPRIGRTLAGSAAGGGANVLQSALTGDTDPESLKKAALIGGAMGAVPGALSARLPRAGQPVTPPGVATMAARPRPVPHVRPDPQGAIIQNYVAKVQHINQTIADPAQKAAALTQARADYIAQRQQANQPAPVQPAPQPVAVEQPTAQAPAVAPGMGEDAFSAQILQLSEPGGKAAERAASIHALQSDPLWGQMVTELNALPPKQKAKELKELPRDFRQAIEQPLAARSTQQVLPPEPVQPAQVAAQQIQAPRPVRPIIPQDAFIEGAQPSGDTLINQRARRARPVQLEERTAPPAQQPEIVPPRTYPAPVIEQPSGLPGQGREIVPARRPPNPLTDLPPIQRGPAQPITPPWLRPKGQGRPPTTESRPAAPPPEPMRRPEPIPQQTATPETLRPATVNDDAAVQSRIDWINDRATPEQLDQAIKRLEQALPAMAPDVATRQIRVLEAANERRNQLRQEEQLAPKYPARKSSEGLRKGEMQRMQGMTPDERAGFMQSEETRRDTEAAARRALKESRVAANKAARGVVETETSINSRQPVEPPAINPGDRQASRPEPYATHADFGDVTLAENQAGAGRGKVRVTDAQGTEHIINKRSRNQRAIKTKKAAPPDSESLSVPKPNTEAAPTPSVADTVRKLKPRGGPASIKDLRAKGATDADIQAGIDSGELQPTRGDQKINKADELMGDVVGVQASGTPKAKQATPAKIKSLAQFVKESGGIKPSVANRGELGYASTKESGKVAVVNRRGIAADEMRRQAVEAGYGNWDTESDFLNSLRDDVQGRKVTSINQEIDHEAEYKKSLTPDEQAETASFDNFLGDKAAAAAYDRVTGGDVSANAITELEKHTTKHGLSEDILNIIVGEGRAARQGAQKPLLRTDAETQSQPQRQEQLRPKSEQKPMIPLGSPVTAQQGKLKTGDTVVARHEGREIRGDVRGFDRQGKVMIREAGTGEDYKVKAEQVKARVTPGEGTVMGIGFGSLQGGTGRRTPATAPNTLLGRIQAKRPKKTLGQQIGENALSALSLPRALRASADISAPLRQGAILTLPPSQWGRAARAGVRMFEGFSTRRYERIKQEIAAHPDAKTAEDSKLYLGSRAEDKLNGREEDFMSKWAKRIPIVKHSNQAYVTYLDSLRMDTFSKYKQVIDRQGLNPEESTRAYKAAAKWINIATGRGSFGEKIDNAMPALATVLFAPRYTASRFNVLNPVMYAKNAATPGGRAVLKQQMGDLVQFAGVVGATLALAKASGAEVGTDPNSPDFLKIKVGNFRYDGLAGLQQPMRLLYRVANEARRAAGGQKSATKEGAVGILGQFARGKEAPVPAFFHNFLAGENIVGEKFEVKREALRLAAPIIWEDLLEAYQKEGAGGMGKVLPSAVGVGVQNYPPKRRASR